MNYKTRCIHHNLNLDYPKEYYKENYEIQTQITLNNIMNNFIKENINYFNKDYLFIINSQNNINTLITYNILMAIKQLYNIDFKIYGYTYKIKSNIYKDFKISKRKLKQEKRNIILIDCFNPLFNVEKTIFPFKILRQDNFVSRFTITQILILCNWYNLNKDLVKKEFKKESDYLVKKFFGDSLIYRDFEHNKKYDKNIPIKYFKLKGTEEDYKLFDEILKLDNDYILFYECPIEKEDFIIANLSPYITSRNAPLKSFNLNSIAKYDKIKLEFEKAGGQNE